MVFPVLVGRTQSSISAGDCPINDLTPHLSFSFCIADLPSLHPLPQIIQQAGQVWFPDSAFKTAEAIKDFNREGLPLIVFANWRGFSGGMKGDYCKKKKPGRSTVRNCGADDRDSCWNLGVGLVTQVVLDL